MGGVVSRTKKRMKAYVLRPFKKRGYFLTAEEYRERHPTYWDKIGSVGKEVRKGAKKYSVEEVRRLKLKHRDAFVSMRRRLLAAAAPDKTSRLRYMERFFAQRHPPRPSQRVRAAGVVVPGATSGGLEGLGGASHVPHRVAALDDVPAAIDDDDPSSRVNARRTPTRTPTLTPTSSSSRRSRSRSGGTLPETVARRQLDETGAPVGYPPAPALQRWDQYVEDEESRMRDVIEEAAARREEKIGMMKAHYRKKGLGKYVPPPEPAWMTTTMSGNNNDRDDDGNNGDGPENNMMMVLPPWRRPRENPRTVREAVEGFDHELKMRTITWWHAIDLRRTAVASEEAKRHAAAREWGEDAGEQVVRSRVGVFAKPTGHAGGVPCDDADRGGGAGDATLIAETLADDRAARRAYLASLPPPKSPKTSSSKG